MGRTVIEAGNLRPCVVCGKMTKFIDYCFEERLCSEECDNKFTDMLFPTSKNENNITGG